MKSILFSLGFLFLFNSCTGQSSKEIMGADGSSKVKVIVTNNFPEEERIVKPEEEWKKELDKMEFHVIREKGTERAFTGDLWNHKKDGVYTCRACQLPLFDSETKFKSGTGWPSYFEPINKVNVAEAEDTKFGMVRTEVLCARCDGHLGHVFDDSPSTPTGLRYCINSASLDFVSRKNLEKGKEVKQ